MIHKKTGVQFSPFSYESSILGASHTFHFLITLTPLVNVSKYVLVLTFWILHLCWTLAGASVPHFGSSIVFLAEVKE